MLVALLIIAFVLGTVCGVTVQRWRSRRVRVPSSVPVEWTREWLAQSPRADRGELEEA